MTGETQNDYSIKDSCLDSKQKDKEALLESFLDTTSNNGNKLCVKEKEPCSQREAVIRPQQAGKIDFKSLQNRTKFSSDGTWSSGKNNPQSPTGKNKGRDKNKRSGKGDRTPQQLYRLSMTNTRPNPTIGIAYPQQKVTQPKKLDTIRAPITGSYRFHVPSVPEREAELQQEDITYNRCFQEASSNLTSGDYTSQTVTVAHQQHTSQQQANLTRDNINPNSQIHYPDFQGSGANSWHSTEKTFSGANYGISSQKPAHFTESNKAVFGPVSFQYSFPELQDTSVSSFAADQNTQDYMDVTLVNGQMAHGAFTFHSSSDSQEDILNGGQYDRMQEDGRTYQQHSQQPQYLQACHGTQGTLPCYKGRADHGADIDTSCSADQTSNPFSESSAMFSQEEINLHNNGVSTTSLSKTSSASKDSVASPRLISPGNNLTRTLAQNSLPQMHFQPKAYGSSPVNSLHSGPVPFDNNITNTIKCHSRLPQTWEGLNKSFSSVDHNAAPYSVTPPDTQYAFQCQATSEPRQPMPKNGRLPWHNIHLTTAMPNQNRIELSRKLSNQKLPFSLNASKWQDSPKTHKKTPIDNLNNFHSKQQREGFPDHRNEGSKQTCNNKNTFSFENAVDSHPQICESRNKNGFYALNQTLANAPSRGNSFQPLQVPPVNIMSASPYESPLPSPNQNPSSSSTCSSLSPVSGSPTNASSEESRLSMTGPPPPFYPQNCHLKEGKTFKSTDQIISSIESMHPEASRLYSLPTERIKEDHSSYLHENKLIKQNVDNEKGCMGSFLLEPPPPPPYSAHQLLANANLDQLDVFLTCKQCDQNFSNLSSFLDHRQYCGLHTSQNDFKETSKMEDARHYQVDPTKATPLTATSPLMRSTSDLHLSLLGLNKNGDLLLDSDTKEDAKDELLKLGLFNGVTAPPSALSTSDIDIDEAKLDSLITEALNGLGYQSDNSEIDSSFIDAFADDDLSNVKPNCSQINKTKDGMLCENKNKQLTLDGRQMSQIKNLFDFEALSTESKNVLKPSDKQSEPDKADKASLKETTHKAAGETLVSKSQDGAKKMIIQENKSKNENGEINMKCSQTFSKQDILRNNDGNASSGSPPDHSDLTGNSVTQTEEAKDSKRRKTGSGTWSKELIHKIVQQKNKLHKLQVKGSRNSQFSLVMERLVPAQQSSKLGEYDYITDSDEETDPVKLTSRTCLSSGRLKYSSSKSHKDQGGRMREKTSNWKNNATLHYGSKSNETPSTVKKNATRRVRRRSSRSSTSSDLSTPASISSESISSPKSTDRTDSDNEQLGGQKSLCDTENTDSFKQEPFKISSPSFVKGYVAKSTKRYGSAKFLFASSTTPHQEPRSRSLSSISRSKEAEQKPVVGSQNTKQKNEGYNNSGSFTPESQLSSECTPPSCILKETENSNCFVNISKGDGRPVVSYKANDVDCVVKESKETYQTTLVVSDKSNKDYMKNMKEDTLTAVPDKPKCSSQPCHDLSKLKTSGKDTLKLPLREISKKAFSEKKNLSHYDAVSHQVPVNVSQADGFYLCHSSLHNSMIPKDLIKPSPSIYSLENDQNLVKSPLSFDTSPIFGGFSVPVFENRLYSDVSPTKEGYGTFNPNHSGKPVVFDPSYSPFLEQKTWNLMDDVPPILPEELSQLSNPNKNFTEGRSILPGQITITSSDKILSCSAPFGNNISEDELEIKRIVTELESQLQTTKLNCITSTCQQIVDQFGQSKSFSCLHLDQHAESEKGVLYTNTVDSVQMSTSTLPTGLDVQEQYDNPEQSWTCNFHFENLDAQSSLSTSVHGEPNYLDKFYSKENAQSFERVEKMEMHHKNDKCGTMGNPLADKPEDVLENQIYAENLIRSLEAISDSVFTKDASSSDDQRSHFLQQEYKGDGSLSAQSKLNVISQTKLAELESTCTILHFEKQDDLLHPLVNSECSRHSGDESLSLTNIPNILKHDSTKKTLHDEQSINRNVKHDVSSPILHLDTDSEQPYISDENGTDNELSVTERSVIFDKDKDEQKSCLQTTQNPLQQLQLFVARTVKNNEEEISLPSYPVLTSSGHVSFAEDKPEENQDQLDAALVATQRESLPETAKDVDGEGSVVCENGKSDSNESEHGESQIYGKAMEEPLVTESSSSAFQKETQSCCSDKENIKISESLNTDHNELSLSYNISLKHLAEPVQNSNQMPMELKHKEAKKTTLTFTKHDVLESASSKVLIDDLQQKQTNHSDSLINREQPAQLSLAEGLLQLQSAQEEPIDKGAQAVNEIVEVITQNRLSVDDDAHSHVESNTEKMWHDLDKYSPISMDNPQSPRTEDNDILSTTEQNQITFKNTASSDLSYNLLHVPDKINEDLPLNPALNTASEAPLVTLVESPCSLYIGETAIRQDEVHKDVKSEVRESMSKRLYDKAEIVSCDTDTFINVAESIPECQVSQTLSKKNLISNCDVPLNALFPCQNSINLESQISEKESLMALNNQHNQDTYCSRDITVQMDNDYKEGGVVSDPNPVIDFHPISNGVTSLDACHPPLETIDYMDLHSDLMKKSNTQNLDTSISFQEPGEPATCKNCPLPKNMPRSPNSQIPRDLCNVIDCFGDTSSQLKQLDSQGKKTSLSKLEKFPADRFESVTEYVISKQSTHKVMITCDICSATFRSKPGLKRHQAMKHNPKKDKTAQIQETLEKNVDSKIHADLLKEGIITALADVEIDKNCLDCSTQDHTVQDDVQTVLGHQDVVNPEDTEMAPDTPTTGKLSVSKDSQGNANIVPGESELPMIESEEKYKQKNLEVKQKQKIMPPQGKYKKNTKMQIGTESSDYKTEQKGKTADIFSEDILCIIKSDLLQAITPNFPTTSRHNENQNVSLQTHSDQERKMLGNAEEQGVLPNKLLYDMEFQKNQQALSPCKDDLNIQTETTSQTESDSHNTEMQLSDIPLESFQDMRESCISIEQEDTRESVEMFSKEATHTEILGEADEINCARTNKESLDNTTLCPCAAPSTEVNKEPSDLESLIDDETKFSELFPMDEQIIRKKCTRVYGKRNKKQKPPSELSIGNTGIKASQDDGDCGKKSFLTSCEYRTISVDDALMLDMCYNSSLNTDGVSGDENMTNATENLKKEHATDIFFQGNDDTASQCELSVTIWEACKDTAAEGLLTLESPKESISNDQAVSGEKNSLNLSDNLESATTSPVHASQYSAIDVQNLNSKYQLPEISLFEVNKEGLIDTTINQKDIALQILKPSKRQEEGKTKSRSELGMKSKDKQYKCKVCFQWFLTLGELDFHKLSHNPLPPPTCYMCVQRKFSSREQLRDHLKEKHAKNKAGIWACGMCLKEISDVWMYNEHLREHATQFARKGQAQKSVLGLRGCFIEENAVKNFLSSIMHRRTSKSNKSGAVTTKTCTSKEPRAVKENLEHDSVTKYGLEVIQAEKFNTNGSENSSTTEISEHADKNELIQKNIVMHPDCKDPSRDCHHCGKQFPKPFKLQRHLVVHSLQKMYLCHRCPVFYQDMQELKTHLKEKHLEVQEPEVKHTTLYACELCADVMHVIKKSFICSTCNYTFSKKEQYDRHMEKHLAGGNKTFKFRGVMRPCKPCKDDYFDLDSSLTMDCAPPNKKRKISTDNVIETSSDSGIASVASLQNTESHLSNETIPLTSDFFSEDLHVPLPQEQDMTIKTEDIVDDFSKLLEVMEQTQLDIDIEEPCFGSDISKTKLGEGGFNVLGIAEDNIINDGKTGPTVEMVDEAIDSFNFQHNQSTKDQISSCEIKFIENMHQGKAKSNEFKDYEEMFGIIKSHSSLENSPSCENMPQNNGNLAGPISENDDLHNSELNTQMMVDRMLTHNAEKQDFIIECETKDNPKPFEVHHKEMGNSQRHPCNVQSNTEIQTRTTKLCNTSEFQNVAIREKVSSKFNENTKHDCVKQTDSNPKNSSNCQGAIDASYKNLKPNISTIRSEEKDFLHSNLNLQQKKRKQYKLSPGSKLSASTRENMDGEVRKKKFRMQNPSKNESLGNYKRTDAINDHPALSSMREDVTNNKLHLKTKIGGFVMQPKKNSFDNFPPQKTEIRHFTGDFKGKKGMYGKPLHTIMSKAPSSSVSSSLNKHRTVSGVKSIEPHIFRTAESQNHLLSQLFGQKLTSFKIPLRKDALE
ncbi:LOW QUALITY PROTEIN: uncharacterized protein LOC114658087 [Erpetoichthys calabaricus]|uniref:LOW QUALITY PROTEIN: uncharacterized protein LOC114658087 n=1 Tax=Erpetoichthys calabaricus TaxID=27687 RepID=UPI002234BC53|nr:LOW QUALITY PROTEIN: uncharacterized protein LOC114658087 [Erpetoichthys calabaricus]